MVVLSAAVVNKSGKAIAARVFVPTNRLHIEGLLTAFPKLISAESQHTYVETDSVRYVYQPIEALYLVLITNKQSNIMEDLETLRMLAKLVPEYCGGHDEAAVQKKAFELIFAFDEAISLGYKENVTMEQIKTYTEMDSHEERLQKILIESKISEARQKMRERAEQIDKQKAEMQAKLKDQSRLQALANRSMGPMASMSSASLQRPETKPMPAEEPVKPAAAEVAPKPIPKGMMLGAPREAVGRDFADTFRKEDGRQRW